VRAKSEGSQEELGYPDISGKGGYPDLLDVQDIPVGMLPYGIKKKLDLARAFASQPKLLLLDEPAAGLGAGDLDELVNLIKGAQRQFKTSVLLVEHNMSLVNRLCDRIVVLDFGEKIAEGTPEEIKRNPKVIEAYLGVSGDSGRDEKVSVTTLETKAEIPSAPILEVKGIDLHYGAVKALSGVSLKLSEKSINAVLGSNGAGKSSLMRAISGLERLSNGEILYQGERILHYLQTPRPDKIVRQGVVHVQEGRQIFKELSIMENLRVAGYTSKDRKQRALNIEKVFHYFPKLKDSLKLRDAGNLSGGQQQMVAIGQALMMEPKVLLLDEPSLGLSPNLVAELFEIVKQIAIQEDCSILLVEQNVEMALKYSSYAYFLETGFLVKQGKSEDLRRDDEIRKLYLGG
jgi:ABC-type branched-subunit amino acid transport system ATPase component